MALSDTPSPAGANHNKTPESCHVPNPDDLQLESHLLLCKMLVSEIQDQNVEFEFVFKDVDKQRSALQAFKSVLRKREVLLEFEN